MAALGDERGQLGFPISDPLKLSGENGDDRYQFFARGLIYLRRDPDAVRFAYLRP